MKKLSIITALLLVALAVFGQTKSDLQFIEQTLENRGEVVLRFPHNGNRELVRELSHIMSIDKVNDTYVEAYANAREYEQFKTYNIEYEPVYEYYTQTRALNMANTVAQMANWDRYPTYAVYLELMRNYARDYPTLCKMDTIGYSVYGRPIINMTISDNVGVDEDEPEFWWSSTMHGDETSGWYFLIRLVDDLLTKYGTDPQITNLVNNVEIYISPLTNPDGTFYQSNDGTSIQSARRYNYNSVDLNRNFPFVTNTASHTAEYPNEPEITMMTAYADEHNFVMSANCHGGDECMNYPWDEDGWTHARHPNPDDDWWEYISWMFVDTVHAINSSRFTGPSDVSGSNGVTKGSEWYSIDGGRQDYMNYYKHIKETTVEFTTTKKLGTENLNTYWGYYRKSILNYTEQVLYGFRGIVTDGCTNQPLSGVQVFINNHDADGTEVYTADPVGDYHRPIYAGTYSVTFSKEGYTSQTFEITTQNMACQRLDVTLYPEGTIVPTFTANPTTLYEGSNVQFSNTTSGNYVSASWTFDGGSPATSTATNPTVTYSTHGTYDATLTIVNTNGCSSSATEHITVYEAVPPVADFSASETQITAGNSVTFTDLSTNMPTSWSWTFEGGTPATSNLQNPTVTYSEPGEYTVTLVASNAFGSDTETKTAYISVAAVYNMSNETIYVCNGTYKDPGGDSNYPNNANYTQTIYPSTEGAYVRLNFTSFSLQAASGWYSTCSDLFYIYDGTSTSATALVNGVCGTNNPGTVTATNADGALTIVFTSNNTTNAAGWEAEISCYMPEPEAIFTAEISENCTRNIATTNESEYATSYLWAFGDGTTSTETAPTHTYTENGTYTITLTASNANGSSTATQQIEVEIPEVTSVTNASGCGSATLTLSAQGNGTLHWFDAQTGGTELGTGNSYTNAFAGTTTIYVESQIGSEETYNVGISDNTSATAYTNNTGQNRGLTFTVSQALTLVSVDVYCTQANQTKTITISNSSNQQVYSQSHTLASGLNTLTLNVDLEPGTYNIYANSVRYTYRQNGSFPYSVENVISITGPYNTNTYYYTFFNWVVKTGNVCTSERTPVTATITESGSIDLGEPITQCGGSATIDAGNGFNSYTWSNGQTTQSITVSQSGTYTVTASNGQCEVTASRSVTINPVPSVSIAENGNVLTANATSGTGNYNYLWSTDATTQSISITSDGNYCVTATDANGCSASECSNTTIPVISINIPEVENGSINGNGSVQYGSDYTFTVVPDNCYEIGTVTVNGNAVTLDANNSYTIQNVTAEQTINATFSQISYSVSASAGNGGAINGAPNMINCGEDLTFTVTPNDCYEIASVTINGTPVTPTNNIYTISNVTEPQSINATFSQISYTITASAGNGGTISNVGNTTVNCGDYITYTITPDEDYMISDVLVDGQSIGSVSSYQFTNVIANHTISASFELIPAGEVVIVVNTDTEGGSVNPTGTQTITEGDNFPFTVTPDNCYEIGIVTVNGNEVTLDENNSYTIENVTEPQNINVTFNRLSYIITASASEGGTITPSGNVEVNCGDNKEFVITANEGYEIADVIVDGQSAINDIASYAVIGASASYTFENVTEDGHIIEVIFTEIIVVPECNAVTNLTAQVESYGIVLSWNAAENAISYDIYRNGERIATETNTSTIDLQGHEGDSYYIITNCANGGSSDASETITTIAEPNCNAVTDLTAMVESYGIVLTWNAAENAVSYDIYRNGERIATETGTSSIDLQGHEGDTYYIITNCANGGTSDASETATAIATVISEVETSIDIFPNPTNDILNITSSETISEIEIVNTLGQVVYRTEVNSDNAVCDVNGLATGFYVAKVRTLSLSKGTAIVQKKFIKE
ncbi:MAG: PKD domain-containing protein [Bacteroidales bacterium]|nr:PKD domain-containing protein [Bacteroidales bacterium]